MSASTATNASSSMGDTNIRVITFSGSKSDWENWNEKFIVQAYIRGYEDLITGETKLPASHDDQGDKVTLNADEKVVLENNQRGYSNLILSIDTSTDAGKVAFATVIGAKTLHNPKGSLPLAFERLRNKYEPHTTSQLVQLERNFYQMKLTKNQDPDVFITKLEALKLKIGQLGNNLTEKSLIVHVLNSLPDQYEMEIKMIEYKMELALKEKKEFSIEEVRSE
jgi:gag-polypeptide of LTR copia-type